MMRERRTPKAEITSSSMADIAFLLIIFFMVTAVFSAAKGLEFALPPEDSGSPDPVPAISFKVLEDGTFLMDCMPATPGDIAPYVAPKLANWPDKPVVIYTRPDAPYATMVSIYDELMQLARPSDEGGLGLSKPPNISVPTGSDVREYERLFGTNPFDAEC